MADSLASLFTLVCFTRRLAQTRKDVAAVFSGLLRTSVDGRQPCLAYLEEHRDLLVTLTKG